MMDIIGTLLAGLRSQATCDHCDAEDHWLDELRLHSLSRSVDCDGNCSVSVCHGRTGMVDLCTDCHRELIRER